MRGEQRIGDEWVAGEGAEWCSLDPAAEEPVWTLRAASVVQVGAAVEAARAEAPVWSARPESERLGFLRAYEERLRADRQRFADLLSRETGKPRWEAQTELDAMIGKVGISIEMAALRRTEERLEMTGAQARTRFRPIGVMAVLGPFNLPGHLPNGHIVPALLAGNAVVLKPSELTPAVGAHMVELWQDAGLPAGALQLVQGGREIGEALVSHPGIDGVLFTGSYAGGRAIQQGVAGRPELLVALEMGGNNPLVVEPVRNRGAAVMHTLLSAFITAGQRCTCARRLIVREGGEGDGFVEALMEAMGALRVGLPTDEPEPFVGPMISRAAAEKLLGAQDELGRRGARLLVPLRRDSRCAALLHPGLIDVTEIRDREDKELFGPLLQVVRVPDFDAAIAEANRTAYGLAAGLLSDDRASFERFWREVRAGVVNWNRQTTGASGRLAFGGMGRSGNHRPAGAWAADYCSDPVASLEAHVLELPGSLPPGLPTDPSA